MKTVLSAILNLTEAVVTLAWILWTVFRRDDEGKRLHLKTFRYFTTDSNLLAMAAAFVTAAFELSDGALPRGVMLFKLVGTASVTVTLLTVLFFLGPTMGYGKMLGGDGLWVHLLGPLLAIVSFCLFDGGEAVGGSWLFGLTPVAVYGILYCVMVLLIGEERGGWEDFYGFNAGGRWFISLPAMLAGGALVSLLLTLAHDMLL